LDSAKQYLAAIANMRTLDHICRELHTNIDNKDEAKNIIKLLIITIRASPTWWDRKLEKIKNYSVPKPGNDLSRGTNNEQAERIVTNCEEFD
jgi:hypothetical protein